MRRRAYVWRPARIAALWLGALVLGWALAALGGCEQAAPARFPHQAHLASARCGEPGQMECASCTSCHAKIRTSDAQATEPPSDCARCHEQPTSSVTAEVQRLRTRERAAQPIRFEHPAHLGLPEIAGQCVGCHPGAVDDGASGATFPPMAECLACHRHQEQFDGGRCALCHGLSDLRSRVPRTVLRHDLGFVRDHRDVANQRSGACRACHAEAECTACHDDGQPLTPERRRPEALDREQVHRGDYLSRHAIEARSASGSCVRCHSSASCDACHVSRGVSAARVGSVSPHPVGWIGATSSPDFHGRSARRELVSCAGCHEQGPATICVQCHRVGGRAGNPHPAGYQSTQATSAGSCRYCHGS